MEITTGTGAQGARSTALSSKRGQCLCHALIGIAGSYIKKINSKNDGVWSGEGTEPPLQYNEI